MGFPGQQFMPKRMKLGQINNTPIGLPRLSNIKGNAAGDLDVPGFITGKKVGAFVYLNNPSILNVAVANTYYDITGDETAAPVFGFSAAVIQPTGLRYDEKKTQYFELDWHATLSSSLPATEIHLGFKKNGVLQTPSLMAMFCQNKDQEYAVSGTFVVELAEGEELTGVFTANKISNITFEHYTTTIAEFFD